jgi:diguanylate cyclase (GGDEF)-like protein
MGDEFADKEFSYFRQVNENVTWSCGYGELLYDENGDGLLNGSLVAVGLREGEKHHKSLEPIVDPALQAEPNIIELTDRLISFLESTTEDLQDYIKMLEKMASHDQLTQIYNRAALDYYFDDLIKNLSPFQSMAMIMFDIDHFKRVNDTYGHDVGDKVIVGVVNAIKERLPDDAIFARWGGEEFMCLLPVSDKATSMDLAERVRLRVSVTDFTPVDQVTISVGVALVGSNTDKTVCFAKVDKALYEAKETGRNKVVFYEQ